MLQVDRLERLLEATAQIRGRLAANDGGEECPGARFDPDGQISHLKRVERRMVGHREGIADEIADGRKHAGHHVGILDADSASLHVLQQETGRPLDEEHLLDAKQQRVREHDLAKGAAGAKRLDPPLQRPPGQAVLQGAVERLDHRRQAGRHRLADGGAHHREQCVGERLRVALDGRRDGVLDRRGQRPRELGVRRAQPQGLRQHGGHVPGMHGGILEPRSERLERPLLRAHEDRADGGEGVVLRRVRLSPAVAGGAGRGIAHAATPWRRAA